MDFGVNWAGAEGGAAAIIEPASPSIGIMPGEWDWMRTLETVTSGVGAVAKTVADLQIAKEQVAVRREDRAFDQFMRTVSLGAQRDVMSTAADIERVKAQTALAIEQRRLKGAQGLTVLPLLSGEGGGSWMLWLTIAGLVLAYWSLRKR